MNDWLICWLIALFLDNFWFLLTHSFSGLFSESFIESFGHSFRESFSGSFSGSFSESSVSHSLSHWVSHWVSHSVSHWVSHSVGHWVSHSVGHSVGHLVSHSVSRSMSELLIHTCDSNLSWTPVLPPPGPETTVCLTSPAAVYFPKNQRGGLKKQGEGWAGSLVAVLSTSGMHHPWITLITPLDLYQVTKRWSSWMEEEDGRSSSNPRQ